MAEPTPEALAANKDKCLEIVEGLPHLDGLERVMVLERVAAVHDGRVAAAARAASGDRRGRASVGGQVALVMQFATAVLVFSQSRESPGSRTLALVIAGGSVLLGGLSVLLVHSTRIGTLRRGRLRRWVVRAVGPGHYEVPLDWAMLALLVAAGSAARCVVRVLVTRADRREVIDALDLAERRLAAARLSVAPLAWGTAAAERETRWRLGALVRVHASAAATAAGAADMQRIADSLISGLVVWAKGDIEGLLVNAPQVTGKQRWSPVVTRLGWTAVFAGAAAFGPRYVSALAAFGPYLWAAAVGTLVAGTPAPAQAISKIAESLLPKHGRVDG